MIDTPGVAFLFIMLGLLPASAAKRSGF